MNLFAGDQFSFFATTPKGIEPLLTEELRSLGALNPAQTRAGVAFAGDLSTAYQPVSGRVWQAGSFFLWSVFLPQVRTSSMLELNPLTGMSI